VPLLGFAADAPQMSDDELNALQARHLAYRAELKRQGVIVANGPLDEQSDVRPQRRRSIGPGGPPRV